MIKIISNIIIWALSISYPILIYFYSHLPYIHYYPIGLIGIIFLRNVSFRNKNCFTKMLVYQILGTAALLIPLMLWKANWMHLLYPVIMSLAMSLTFGLTLIYPPCMIERIARLRKHNLDERGLRYVRKVTIMWCIFGVVNAAISITTVFLQNMKFWAIYNGFISYFLMGILFVGEIVYRHFIHHKRVLKS